MAIIAWDIGYYDIKPKFLVFLVNPVKNRSTTDKEDVFFRNVLRELQKKAARTKAKLTTDVNAKLVRISLVPGKGLKVNFDFEKLVLT